jgi:hypothetical protein
MRRRARKRWRRLSNTAAALWRNGGGCERHHSPRACSRCVSRLQRSSSSFVAPKAGERCRKKNRIRTIRSRCCIALARFLPTGPLRLRVRRAAYSAAVASRSSRAMMSANGRFDRQFPGRSVFPRRLFARLRRDYVLRRACIRRAGGHETRRRRAARRIGVGPA